MLINICIILNPFKGVLRQTGWLPCRCCWTEMTDSETEYGQHRSSFGVKQTPTSPTHYSSRSWIEHVLRQGRTGFFHHVQLQSLKMSCCEPACSADLTSKLARWDWIATCNPWLRKRSFVQCWSRWNSLSQRGQNLGRKKKAPYTLFQAQYAMYRQGNEGKMQNQEADTWK